MVANKEPNEKSIFLQAIEIATDEERADYLQSACAGNDALRVEIEALLRAHARPQHILDAPDVGSPTLDQPPLEKPGTQIGPYKLLQQIGEGGFGVVYMAEQTEPVERRVALKIIKPGMDTRQVIARFESEEQALAMMEHPNIAKVFEVGMTEFGRPYFVMELVKGIPITQYCDEHHLTPRERLELFVPVCHAIQHAHQKGIIHRDIKPTNVLVAEYDDRPVPKIIDFGVAKAIQQRLTERTMFTVLGQVVGTIEYMSPEQAKLNQLDIDTRSDVYSLGVLLYELLTGDTPFDRQRLRSAAFDELLRIIREEEPPKPSTRLNSSHSLPSVAANRHIEPKKLSTLVRGELDWIVMKALEKDRTRRYETANGFAADIEHYLSDEPVLACPPSAAYRARKFVRRNKGPVMAVSLVLLALAGGTVGTTWGLVRADSARRDAVAARLAESERAEGERQARQQAEAREAETQAVLGFVEDRIFAAIRPVSIKEGLGHDVKLRTVLEAALPYLETSFKDRPRMEARLRVTLGQSFSDLGEPKTAFPQFQAGRTLYSEHCGPQHPDTLHCMNHLAKTYFALGQYAESVKLAEETLTLRKATLGLRHPDTLTSMNDLANGYSKLGRHSEALKLHKETLALRRATLGLNHADTLVSLNDLANSYSESGRVAEAGELYEEAMELMKTTLGLEHPDTLTTMHNVACSYRGLGRHAEALKLQDQVLALRTKVLGPDHHYTLASMEHRAMVLFDLGRRAEAVRYHEETLALHKAKLGPDHPDTLWSMHNLATNYLSDGRPADALRLYQETLARRKATLGPDHPDTLQSVCGIGESLIQLDQGAEAVPIIDEWLMRAAKHVVDQGLTARMTRIRLRHFVKARDAAGCRATAEIWEKLERTDADSLYDAACMRAVTAAVIRDSDKTETAAQEAAAEAAQAMVWLRQAVAAGYKDGEQVKNDEDLDALRDREDFKSLMAELEKGQQSTDVK